MPEPVLTVPTRRSRFLTKSPSGFVGSFSDAWRRGEGAYREKVRRYEAGMGGFERTLYYGGLDVGLLAGPKALRRPSGLSNAVEMRAKGVPENRVWQKTGWIKGAEGKWRFEIDDSMAKFNIQEMKKTADLLQRYSPDSPVPESALNQMRNTRDTWKLGEILDHPVLFEQYPHLAETPVSLVRGTGGAYTKYGGIEIGTEALKDKSTLIHEIQHAIQEYEGFARGGSPTGLSESVFMDELAKLRIHEKRMGREVTPERLSELREIARHRAYRNLAGEIEARDAASRMTWGPQERRTVRPYSSELIPREKWIVR